MQYMVNGEIPKLERYTQMLDTGKMRHLEPFVRHYVLPFLFQLVALFGPFHRL